MREGHIYVAQHGPRPEEDLAFFMRPRHTAFVFAKLGGPVADGLIKIGFTEQHPLLRVKHHCSMTRGAMTILGVVDGSWNEEQDLLRRFAHLAVREPFGAEWFRPAPDLVAFIEQMPRTYEASSLEYTRQRRRRQAFELVRVQSAT